MLHVSELSVNWVIIGLNDGLLPVLWQTIISTNDNFSSIIPRRTDFNENIMETNQFSFTKLLWNAWTINLQPFCTGREQLKIVVGIQTFFMWTSNNQNQCSTHQQQTWWSETKWSNHWNVWSLNTDGISQQAEYVWFCKDCVAGKLWNSNVFSETSLISLDRFHCATSKLQTGNWVIW